MVESSGDDRSRRRFEQVDLTEATFEHVDLTRARFRYVALNDASMRNAELVNVEINGLIDNLRINDVDVVPLIEAELDRRHPERVKLRPRDAAGFREAWDLIEQQWRLTVERARQLPVDTLHTRVDDEWSFIETLRHLLFATDSWVRRTVLSDPAPYDALDLPHTEMGDVAGVPHDPHARPTLDDVLALRAERMATVRRLIDGLTDEALGTTTEPASEPGYPVAGRYSVGECLRVVIDEEWAHRQFAERDLAVLEGRQRERVQKSTG